MIKSNIINIIHKLGKSFTYFNIIIIVLILIIIIYNNNNSVKKIGIVRTTQV